MSSINLCETLKIHLVTKHKNYKCSPSIFTIIHPPSNIAFGLGMGRHCCKKILLVVVVPHQ